MACRQTAERVTSMGSSESRGLVSTYCFGRKFCTPPLDADKLIWRWTANGPYTEKSCYHTTFQGSTSSRAWKLIWKSWAPPRVKFFHWLADQNPCWMADRLACRGLQYHSACLVCGQAPETMLRLTLPCPSTLLIWQEILSWHRMTCTPPAREISLTE